MSMSQPKLQDFRNDLRMAVAADLERNRLRRRHLRRTVAWGGPGTVLAAVGISLGLVIGAGGGMSSADAAILNSAQSFLTPPPGTVLHVAASITVGSQPASPYELWTTDSSSRAIKEGVELGWNGSQMSTYDPATNTITDLPNSPSHPPVDVAATLRSLITSGQAHVTGTTVVAGVPAYVLSLTGVPDGQGVANGTYDVAKSDYRPLLVQSSVACDDHGDICPETVSYRAYEFLPATPANLSLVDLAAQHPGARVQSGSAADSSG